jgi:hypothetical protein
MAVDAGSDASSDGGPGGASSGESCMLAPPPRVPAAGTTLKFPMDLVYEGRPFVFGEENTVPGGRSVLPLDLRFYISEAELVTAGGGSVPVDIVTENGALAPYGVFLFSAEDAAAQTLYVRAPAGAYEGLKFSVGLTGACNQNGGTGKAFPLSADSQMVWPLGRGYLFLRYEGRVSLPAADADGGQLPRLPDKLHMGSDLRNLDRSSGVAVRIPGAFGVPASGAQTRHIQVAIDQIFKAATGDVDVSDYPLAGAPIEILDGERLRRAGGSLPLFVFAP